MDDNFHITFGWRFGMEWSHQGNSSRSRYGQRYETAWGFRLGRRYSRSGPVYGSFSQWRQ